MSKFLGLMAFSPKKRIARTILIMHVNDYLGMSAIQESRDCQGYRVQWVLKARKVSRACEAYLVSEDHREVKVRGNPSL